MEKLLNQRVKICSSNINFYQLITKLLYIDKNSYQKEILI